MLKHLLLQIINNASLCDGDYGNLFHICDAFRICRDACPQFGGAPTVKKGLGCTRARASQGINSPKWANVRQPQLRKDKQEDIC